ncbi:ATP-binding cassette sub-family C member 4-like isoform X2 [Toxorhynchites rutilus septentrionalis]|uniref:ATP-binding cassette sub-family C member 4-like isoform X2 n=1 Tax=Toxorhynchites rutilus septentrionalis TaxID=329112 RepID=UPI00247ADD1B|nr:ATP-binding cassette sub-family C member 4-like isoform X2 [Toxorhynchites rutilus septentrionalis]
MQHDMDSKRSTNTPAQHPYTRANFISKYFFWWLVGLLRVGLRRQIVTADIDEALPTHRSERIGSQFGEFWQSEVHREGQQKKKKKKSNEEEEKRPWKLLKVLFRIYGFGVLLFGGLYGILESTCRIIQPFLLGQLILYFDQRRGVNARDDDDGDDNGGPRMSKGENISTEHPLIAPGQAYLYAGGIVLTVVLPLAIFHLYQLFLLEVGLKIRIGCCALIYRKVLQLSVAFSADGLTGRVINLISNDVSRFDYAVIFFHDLWKGPVELVIVSVLVHRLMGWPGLIGIVALLLFIPGQAWLGKRAASYRLRAALATDGRVNFVNEVLHGIMVVKMYVWEEPFEALVQKLRRNEIRALRGSAFIRSGLFSLRIIPKVSIFLSLVTYVYAGNALTAVRVYMLVSFFSVINHSVVEFWPLAVTSCAEAWVSMKRIEKFLLEDSELCRTSSPIKERTDAKMAISNVTAGWPSSNFVLQLSKWVVQDGETWIIVGQVGAGKSTLLNLVLGELIPTEGLISICGTVSICCQKPWIFEGTVRENIIFVEPFDEDRYNEVIKVCALKTDFELWPNSDSTIVGERGVSLSGGQKARVNLARAIYRIADVYLLDDPLSAVDAHVGKFIYEECISKFLEDRTCILVTHQLQLLKGAEKTVVLRNGKIEGIGMYDEFRNYARNVNCNKSSDKEELDNKIPINGKTVCENSITDSHQQEMVEETQLDGNVGCKVYVDFLKSVKSASFVVLVCVLLLAWQTSSTGTDYFVFIWVNWESNDQSTWTTQQHILVYLGLVVSTLLLSVNSFAFFEMCLRASLHLHSSLYKGVTRTAMYFFNVNSSGRVMNRFSKDIGLIDSSLPVVLIDSLHFFLELAGIVVIISLANYWLLIPTAVVGVVFYILRFIFLRSARNVKRVEAIARSPVLAHTSSTIEGLVTIRAFRAQRQMLLEFDCRQNRNSSAAFMFGAITRGFAFWLDLICALYIAMVVFSFLVLGQEILSGNVGLAITQVLNLIGMCNWGLRQTAELENQMTSVERVMEYAQLEREPDTTGQVVENVPIDWPQEGAVVFKDVFMRYTPNSEPVLKELSFDIEPKERIGIVGRTGAGKSSIIQALFRLAPIGGAGRHGCIEIDRIDIGGVPLRRHRAAISIIPQDPVIFSGSLRNNLDPFGKVKEEQIWKTLEQRAAHVDIFLSIDTNVSANYR